MDAKATRAAELKAQQDKFPEWVRQEFKAFHAGGKDQLDAVLTVARRLEFDEDYVDELAGRIKEARRQREAPRQGFQRRDFSRKPPEPDSAVLEGLIARDGVKTSEEPQPEGPEA